MKSKPLKVGTILRLPWWSNAPRAVVVGFDRDPPPCVRLLGLGGVIRGRVMIVRVDRLEKRGKRTGSIALRHMIVPCPCGNDCGGRVNFAEAIGLLRRISK